MTNCHYETRCRSFYVWDTGLPNAFAIKFKKVLEDEEYKNYKHRFRFLIPGRDWRVDIPYGTDSRGQFACADEWILEFRSNFESGRIWLTKCKIKTEFIVWISSGSEIKLFPERSRSAKLGSELIIGSTQLRLCVGLTLIYSLIMKPSNQA